MCIRDRDKPDTASLHSHLRHLIFDLSHTLEDAGVRGLLVRGRSTLAIDTSQVECDYYNFLRGDRSTISSCLLYTSQYAAQPLIGRLHPGGPGSAVMCVRGDRVHEAVLQPAIQLPALQESALQHLSLIHI